jgi:Icc-related predicted phosphoesterase
MAFHCLFVSDLHGRIDRYEKLFAAIERERPAAVFVGGDLIAVGRIAASGSDLICDEPIEELIRPGLSRLRRQLASAYPEVYLIPGNDDPRALVPLLGELEHDGLLRYMHRRSGQLGPHPVFGYACIPPSPLRLKDWERYDVSRHVDPGCTSPEEGYRSEPRPRSDVRYGTIAGDLTELAGDNDLEAAIFLFHVPPYQTQLDRAALDGIMVDHVPVDVNIGSIAVRRFIEKKQPLLTLHGHVHESSRLTGDWRDTIGRTICLSAAWDGTELALVRFDPARPTEASRELI